MEMTQIEDQARAREMLKAFRNARGDLDVRKTAEETFILVYGMDKRLELGDQAFQNLNQKVELVDKKTDRCPVPRGDMTFEQAHKSPPPPKGLYLTGKQFILLIIIIVLAASGGAALAAELGGL